MCSSLKLLVALGAVASLCPIGCSSKLPAQSNTLGESPSKSAPEIVTSVVSADGSSETSSVTSKNAPPVIGQLKSRHHTILIHTGSDGPRFTVATLDGNVIAEALSVDEIQAQHPEIYKTYKESFANYEVYLDASIHPNAPSGR
jgi:hypothetical protein